MRAIAFSLIVAIALAALLPAQALRGAASGMLAFVGLLIAMLIPTMALNVTALRPRPGRRKEAERTGTALLVQFDYWAAMLWLSVILAVLLIGGNVLQWNDWVSHIVIRSWTITLRPLAVLNAAIWFCGALLAAKLAGFISGFRSLLKLHIKQVLEEAATEDSPRKRPLEIEERPANPDFGKIVQD